MQQNDSLADGYIRLDSCRETWTGVVADLVAAGYPTLTLELRGQGESPLGDPHEYGPGALAADVAAAVVAHGIAGPIVLVG